MWRLCRDGGLCYDYSYNRLVILNATGQDGVTSLGKYHEVSYTRWIVSPFSDLDFVYAATDVPLLTITIDSINTSCPFVSAFIALYFLL